MGIIGFVTQVWGVIFVCWKHKWKMWNGFWEAIKKAVTFKNQTRPHVYNTWLVASIQKPAVLIYLLFRSWLFHFNLVMKLIHLWSFGSPAKINALWIYFLVIYIQFWVFFQKIYIILACIQWGFEYQRSGSGFILILDF